MSIEPDLARQLAEYKAQSAARSTPERAAIVERAIENLRASGIESTALAVGASAPELTLPDALGRPVELASLWRDRPAIVVFYRGGWCPYCNLELRAWQKLLPEVHAAGAALVAISPQSPDNSLSTAEKNELAFVVLSDSSFAAANAFGIAFVFPDELAALYAEVGINVPAVNANGKWMLPLPATYVIDRGGRIVFAHVDADHRERAEPGDVLRMIATL
jgi:peroxiredoxin